MSNPSERVTRKSASRTQTAASKRDAKAEPAGPRKSASSR
jgi:hypothetical protein